MRLDRFHELPSATPPFASAVLDVTRVDRAAEDDVDRRWRVVEEELTALGAPRDLVARLAERAGAPTGRGGEWTRLLVGAGDRVDTFLVPGRPSRDEAAWGPVPLLMPAVRGLANSVSHAVVRIDRSGADVDVVTGAGPDGASHETVEGDHDVVHKLPTGGASQGRLQMRAEDSWERNAEAVAEALDRLVRAERVEIVLVMGDVRAVGLLERHASDVVSERLVRLDTGGRAAGTSATAEEEAVDEALAVHRAAREAALLDRFAEQRSRQQNAVDGRDDVLEVLARGQVDELLLVDDLGSDATVPVDGVDVPVADALLWQAISTRAAVTLVDPHQVDLRDGMGALLRWSDPSTPHLGAPAMPGHGERPGQSSNEK